MKHNAAQSLMHKALDGTLDATEQRLWQAWLQQNPDDQARFDEQAALTRLLEQVPEAEPPADLPGRIMQAVRASKREKHATILSINQPKEDPMSPKYKWLLIGAAAVIVIGVALANFYPWPPESATQGTIGAVQKAETYQAGQMSADDVTLTDSELQQVLQSDAVQKIVADKPLMAALQTLDGKSIAALQTLDGKQIAALQTLDGKSIAALQTLDGKSIAALQTLDGKSIAALLTLDGKSIAALQTADGKSIAALQTLDGKQIAALQTLDGKSIAALQTLDGKSIAALQTLDGKSIAALQTLDGKSIAALQTLDGKSIAALQTLDGRVFAALQTLDGKTIASMQTADGKTTAE